MNYKVNEGTLYQYSVAEIISFSRSGLLDYSGDVGKLVSYVIQGMQKTIDDLETELEEAKRAAYDPYWDELPEDVTEKIQKAIKILEDI